MRITRLRATGLLALTALCALHAPAAQTDLPAPDKLPARPEMPDPLVMSNGERVQGKEQWFKERRPELKKLIQHYMYGHFPAPVKVEAKVERVDPKALGGKATL